MSWDVFMDKEYPCPCGKGTYREVTEMDDWNRTRENVTMNCAECRIKYIIKHYQSSDGGENWRWVPKESESNVAKKKKYVVLGEWIEVDE